MPARVLVTLILIAILAGGGTVLAAQFIGLPMAALGVIVVLAALGLRVWLDRRL